MVQDVGSGSVVARQEGFDTRGLLAGPHAVFHPGDELRAYLNSISHRCHLFKVAFVWELTKETIYLSLGCLQGGSVEKNRPHIRQSGPDRGPGFLVKVFKTFQVVSCSLGSESESLYWPMPVRSRNILDDARWGHTRTSQAFARRVVTSSTGVLHS